MIDQRVVEVDLPRYASTRMIMGNQVAAALQLLRLSIADLAERAGVSISTVKRVTTAPGVPAISATNLYKIEAALERAGVVFLSEGQNADGGIGLRLKRSPAGPS